MDGEIETGIDGDRQIWKVASFIKTGLFMLLFITVREKETKIGVRMGWYG